LFQILLAIARELHALFKQFHRVIERKVRAFELADDFFQARQRAFKIRLLYAVGFFYRTLIHNRHVSPSSLPSLLASSWGQKQHSNARARTETTALSGLLLSVLQTTA